MKAYVRIVSFILLFVLLSTSTMAAVIQPVEPQWDNVNKVVCNVYFTGTAGSVYCSLIGVSGTTEINGTLTLYEDDSEINSWDIDADTFFVTVSDSFVGTPGATYELVLDVDVVRNGRIEPIYVTSTAECE